MNFPSESMSGANSSEPGCHVLGGTETPVDRTTARTSSRSRTACPGGTQWTPPRAMDECMSASNALSLTTRLRKARSSSSRTPAEAQW